LNLEKVKNLEMSFTLS